MPAALEEYFSKTASLPKADEDNDREKRNLRYRDMLDLVEEDMGAPLDIEFAEVCGKIWGNAKLKELQREELKNIFILSNWTYTKRLI